MTGQVRPAHWSDIPRLVELEQVLFGATAWSAQTWWAELAERPRRAYLVADAAADAAADAPVSAPSADVVDGYAGVDLGGGVADIMTIAVAPRAQGQGLARRLLGELERAARRGGAAYLMLEVRADNAAARGLYDSSGYEVVSVRRRYYQPDDVDAIVMRKVLSTSTTVGGRHVG